MILHAAILCLAVFTSPGDDRNNAATWYALASRNMAAMTEAETTALLLYLRTPDQPPGSQMTDLLTRMQPVLQQFHRGARESYADFGLPMTHPPGGTPMPFLLSIRRLAFLAHADAHAALYSADGLRAARNFDSILNMASDLAAQGIPDASFRAADMGEAVWANVRDAMKQGRFGPAEIVILDETMRSLPADDPFRIGSALIESFDRGLLWCMEQRSTEEGIATLGEYGDFYAEMGAMSEAEFAGESQRFDQFLDTLSQRLGEADPEAIKALQDEVEAGDWGMLAGEALKQMVVADLAGMTEKIRTTSAALADLREAIADMRQAEVIGPDVNAATWYLRAIEALSAVDATLVARAVERDADDRLQHPDVARSLLQKLEACLDLLQRGSSIDYCDFSPMRDAVSLIAPPYAPGMRACLDILLMKADLAIEDDEAHSAAATLAMIGRISHHLAEDERLICARIAHWSFVEVTRRLESWRGEGTEPIVQSMRRMSDADFFGYRAALNRCRKGLADKIAQTVVKHEAVTTWQWNELPPLIDRMHAANVPAFVLLLDCDDPEAGTLIVNRLHALSSMADPGIVEFLVAAQSVLTPLLHAGTLDDLHTMRPHLVDFLGLAEAMRNARPDVRARRALLLQLTPPQATSPTSE